MSTGRFISVGTYPTRNEAEVVQVPLASEGISASVEADDAGGAYPFVFGDGARVLVDEEDAKAASEVLARGPAED